MSDTPRKKCSTCKHSYTPLYKQDELYCENDEHPHNYHETMVVNDNWFCPLHEYREEYAEQQDTR